MPIVLVIINQFIYCALNFLIKIGIVMFYELMYVDWRVNVTVKQPPAENGAYHIEILIGFSLSKIKRCVFFPVCFCNCKIMILQNINVKSSKT